MEGTTGTVVGSRVFHFEAVGSTMDEASRMAAAGAPEGTVVVADSQTAGRGRRNREWTSSPGQDLLLSVVLRPRPAIVPELLMLAALAAANTTKAVAGVTPSIKWPNDVRVNGRKVCGVLADTVQQGDGGLVTVIGVGLNVNMDYTAAAALPQPASSLRTLAGREIPRADTLRVLLGHMDAMYMSLLRGETLLPEWRSMLETLGSHVEVTVGDPSSPDRVIRGLAEDVDDMGRLLVRDQDSRVWPVSAGEVTLQSPAQYP